MDCASGIKREAQGTDTFRSEEFVTGGEKRMPIRSLKNFESRLGLRTPLWQPP
jgi:hypothetical protein